MRSNAIDNQSMTQNVWPVNSVTFYPTFNTFASAGSDVMVSIWDHKVKKRLKQYPKFPGGVAAIAFNCDGSMITVGVSSTWDEGEEGFNPVIPWLGVMKVGDEVKVCFLSVTFLPSLGFFRSFLFSPCCLLFVIAKVVNRKLILLDL